MKRAIAWLLLAGAGAPLAADEAPEEAVPAALAEVDEATAPRLRFMRVFVPAHRRKEWPTGKTTYLPKKAEEFDRLVNAARATPGAFETSGARLVRAHYEARLGGDNVLVGVARFEIANPDSAEKLLPLAPCGIAVEHARWDVDSLGPTGDVATEAHVGLTTGGSTVVVIDRQGVLVVDWSLAGEREPSGTAAFTLDLPRTPLATLWLDLPRELTPAVSAGVVLGEAETTTGLRRWQIELGGGKSVLRLLPRNTGEGDVRRLVLLRQAMRYEFSPAGVDVTAELKLDIHHEPLRHLELVLDDGLQLVRAAVLSPRGEMAVPWLTSDMAADGTRRVTLEFPDALLGADRTLRLRALATLVADRPWRLPGIRPKGSFWQEGNATLLVPTPLSIDSLRMESCRQSKTGALAAPLTGESFEFQFFSPEAYIETKLSRRRVRLSLERGTSIKLSPSETTARVLGELTIDGGERYQLEAEVDGRWTVDSVSSDPPERIRSWSLESAGPGQHLLSVRLAQPLAPDRPLRLSISGRLAAASARRQFDAGDLRMLAFRGADVRQELLALAAAGYPLRRSRVDDLEPLDPAKLSPSQRRLIAAPSADAVYDVLSGAGVWHVTIDPKPPRYKAELLVDVSLSSDSLVESYTIRCLPDAAPVDRLLVHFTHRRRKPPHWNLADEVHRELSARLWTADEVAAAQLTVGGETWEIKLGSPHASPFELLATRATELSGELPLSLAAMPEADAQQGRVLVRTARAATPVVFNSRLQPVTYDAGDAAEQSTVVGSYRYDPAEELGDSATAAVTVSPGGGGRAALVWQSRLESRFEPGGRGWHRASYLLENAGAAEFRFSLPSGATLLGLSVDGVNVSPSDKQGMIAADLPPGRRFARLAVEYDVEGRPWELVGECESAWPKLDLVELIRRWRFSLPPGYLWLGGGGTAVERSWQQRLFGPLGRAAGALPFDAANLDDWFQLVGRSAGDEDAPATDRTEPGLLAEGLPWNSLSLPRAETEDRAGWTIYEVAVTSNGPGPLRVIRGDALRVAGWGFMAFTFAACRWWLRRRAALSTMALGALAAAALLAPDVLTVPAAGAFLGAAAASVVNLLSPPRRGSGRDVLISVASPRLVAPLAVVLIAALAAITSLVGKVSAAEAGPSDGRAAAKLHRVFIPSDEDGNPTGADYLVPVDLLIALERRAAAATNEPDGWLLEAASYDVVLGRGDAPDIVEVVDFKVRLSLRVFKSKAHVAIPLAHKGSNLVLGSAKLNGQPFMLAWDPEGRTLECDVREAGSFQLEFELRPIVQTTGETTGFDISIPRLPAANLELTVPGETSGIEVPAIVGRSAWSDDRRRLSARLGPVDRLTVRWPRRPGGVGPALEVEEFLWLTVRPGAVVLDAFHQYKVSGGEVRRIEFTADPRLRLVPPEAPGSPVADDATTPARDEAPNSPNTVRFDLRQPCFDQLPLRTKWLLTRTSGVGIVRLPLLRPQGAQSVRRWLAVSVDPGLEFKVRDDAALEIVDPKDFMAGWGTADAAPLLAYRLPPENVSWNLATSTRDPLTTVKQSLLLDFERAGALVRFDAELLTTAGYCFQHRLIAPPTFEVDEISLTSNGAERASRWTRDESGRITLFLADRVTGPQQLHLRGRLPTPVEGSMPLPQFAIEGGEMLSRTVMVYRHAGAVISVVDRVGFDDTTDRGAAADAARNGAPARMGRLVAALAAVRSDASGVVAFGRNEPRFTAVQVTSLDYQDEAWQAEVECELNAENGIVDLLRFEIPAQWTGPFEVTPPAAIEVGEGPGPTRRRLTIRPRAGWEGRQRLVIRGPYAAGAPVTTPDVMLEADVVERFVALPTRLGTEPIAWATSRLLPAKLPEPFIATRFTEGFETYRAVGDGPQAVMKLPESFKDIRRVAWADLRLAWQTDGSCICAATFDLEPAGWLNCPLRMPSGWRLVAANVAGVPVTPLVRDDLPWRLPLTSSRLPQRIEVVATGPLPMPSLTLAPISPDVPLIGDLVPESTLWTFSAPPGWTTSSVDDDARPLDPLTAELYRLRNVEGLIDLKDELARSFPAEELAHWYRPWAERLLVGRRKFELLRRKGTTPENPAESDTDNISGGDAAQIAERMGVASVLESLESADLAASRPADLWDSLGADRGSANIFLASRRSARPRFQFTRSRGDGNDSRPIAAACVALAALVLAILLWARVPRDAWRQWPAIWGVLAGVAWWLWLTPSALGWVIVAVSLVSSWRSGWQSVREPAAPAGSTP
jgi:hypothetical protein